MSNIEMMDGKTLNSTLIGILVARREELLKDGKTAKDANLNEDLIEIDASNNKSILKSDKEEYDCICEFINTFLGFELTEPNKIYDIPGIKVKIEGQEKDLFLNLPKNKISDLAKKAKEYERIFGKTLAIKFPDQVYQFQHGSTKVPGSLVSAPEPKLVSESYEEYEARLAEHYKGDGVKPTPTEDNQWRKPYPHEQTNYKGDKPVKSDDYQSEYYRFAGARARKIKGNEPPKAKTGSRFRVTKAEALEGSTVGEKLKNGFGGIFKGGTAGKKLRYLLVGGLAAAAGIYLVANVPLATAALPVVGIYAMFRYLRKKWSKKKKRGNEPEDDVPEDPTGDDTPEDDEPEETHDSPDFKGSVDSLKENLDLLRELEDKIAQEEDAISSLIPTDPDYDTKKAAHEAVLKDYKKQKRQVLENLRVDVQGVYDSYEVESGGPKL